PRVILAAENSLLLREQLIAELGAFRDTDALTVWAGRILPQKNQLATSDAQALEAAFAVKLGELENDRPAENAHLAISKEIEPVGSHTTATRCSQRQQRARKRTRPPPGRAWGKKKGGPVPPSHVTVD